VAAAAEAAAAEAAAAEAAAAEAAAAEAAAAALVVVIKFAKVAGGLEVSVLLLPWEREMLAWDLKVACGVLQKVMLLYLVAAVVA